jgi:hypothetical protein
MIGLNQTRVSNARFLQQNMDALVGLLDQVFVKTLGLTKLPEYWHSIALSFAFFNIVWAVGFGLSLLSPHFRALNTARRVGWLGRIVSQVHALIAVPVGFYLYMDPLLYGNPYDGTTELSYQFNSFVVGYFMWDTLNCLLDVKYNGWVYVLHGVAGFIAYILTFTPIWHWFASISILCEVSTPFVNFHWFLDKTGRSGNELVYLILLCLLLEWISD